MTPDLETQLAEALAAARRNGETIDPAGLPELRDTETAYRVQSRVTTLLDAPVVGYKVGSTSKEAQSILGTDEPGAGVLLAPYLHVSPVRMEVVPAHMPAIEGEFAFRLGRDLSPRSAAFDREEVCAAIDGVTGAIEIVGTRIAGGLAGKGRYLVTADGGANIGLAVGAWRSDWRTLDLPAHPVTVHINGVAKGRGTGARALGDPVNVLIWLANHLARTGEGLRAGMVVSTGTCTGLDAVGPGDRAVADFGTLGSVTIDFDVSPG